MTQKHIDQKMYFYFDESGDPAILGHHGRNLLKDGKVSKTFSVGYVETGNPHDLTVKLEHLRQDLMNDEYLKAIPSIKNLKNGFHANKDCQEVRMAVFKLLKQSDFCAYIIVARKNEDIFRKKFNMSNKKLYKFLVTELLKNQVHLYKNIDIYFSEMRNVLSVQNMTDALKEAVEKSQKRIGTENENLHIYLQQPSHLPLLQVIDYILWAVYRVYEKNEFRYFDFIKDKIKYVYDIFDTKTNHYGVYYYTANNPLTQKNLSPISG